jgi:hypothetical protein
MPFSQSEKIGAWLPPNPTDDRLLPPSIQHWSHNVSSERSPVSWDWYASCPTLAWETRASVGQEQVIAMYRCEVIEPWRPKAGPKADQRGRVYVDMLQNARGYYAVPPYVPRTVPQASVSTPLTWNELA